MSHQARLDALIAKFSPQESKTESKIPSFDDFLDRYLAVELEAVKKRMGSELEREDLEVLIPDMTQRGEEIYNSLFINSISKKKSRSKK